MLFMRDALGGGRKPRNRPGRTAAISSRAMPNTSTSGPTATGYDFTLTTVRYAAAPCQQALALHHAEVRNRVKIKYPI